MAMVGQRTGAMRLMWMAIALAPIGVLAGRLLDLYPTPFAAGAMVPVAWLVAIGFLLARGLPAGVPLYVVFAIIAAVAIGVPTIGTLSGSEDYDFFLGRGADPFIAVAGAVAILAVQLLALRALRRADERLRAPATRRRLLGAATAKEVGAVLGGGVVTVAALAGGIAVANSFEDRPRYGIVEAGGAVRQPAVFSLVFPPGLKTGLAPAQRDGKWGWLDREGREVLPPTYQYLWLRSDHGLAEAQRDGKWGLVDLKGKVVVEPKYDSISVVDAGFAWVKLGGKWGAVDGAGKTLFEPAYPAHGPALRDVVLVTGADKRWRLLDRAGKPVSATDFANLRVVANAFDENGLIAATADGSKWGFVDRSGTFVVEARFDGAFGFSKGGLARVLSGGKWGYVDRTGAYAIQPAYDGVEPLLPNGLAPVKTGKQWGLVDRTGKVVVEPRYEKIEDAGQGLASVKVSGGKWGVVDASGAMVVEPRYANRLRFRPNGLARAELGTSRQGVIDTKGRAVIEPRYYDTAIVDRIGAPTLITVLHSGLRLSVHDAAGKQLVAPRADVDDVFSQSGDTLLLQSIVRRYCTLGRSLCMP